MMKKILALLLCFLAASYADYPWPTNVFEDRFESGDLQTWTSRNLSGTNSTMTLVGSPVFDGVYAAKFSIPMGNFGRKTELTRTIGNSPDIYFSGKFLVPSATTSLIRSDGMNFLAPGKVGYGPTARSGIVMGYSNILYVTVANVQSTVPFTKDVWHEMQIHATCSPTGGIMSATLDGIPCGTVFNANYTNICNEIRVGGSIGAYYQNDSLDFYVDDIVVSRNPITYSASQVHLLYPDFRSRIGAKVIAILGGYQPTDNFEVSLNGIQLFSTPASGRIDFQVDLRDLPRTNVTLTANIVRDGVITASDSYSYDKNYDTTNPRSITIDENNNFCTNGQPFFLVTPFVLAPYMVPSWGTSNLFNVLYGCDWNHKDIAGMQNYLNLANQNGYSVFPTLPFNNGAVKGSTNEFTVASLMNCVSNLNGYPNVAGWVFIDEPELYHYTPEDHYQWWSAAKNYDGSKIVHVNFMGNDFSGIGDYNTALAHTFCYPYLCADSIGFDMYPYEYTSSQSIPLLANAVRNIREWNYDLIPTTAYIQTQDIRVGQGGGAPTPRQIEMMAWLCVVNGSKGIQWFHYFGLTPGENLKAMANFKIAMDENSPWILSNSQLPIGIYSQGSLSTNVYSACWSNGDTSRAYLVNTANTPQTCQIFVGGITNGTVTVTKTITVTNGCFEDVLEPESIQIYSIK